MADEKCFVFEDEIIYLCSLAFDTAVCVLQVWLSRCRENTTGQRVDQLQGVLKELHVHRVVD